MVPRRAPCITGASRRGRTGSRRPRKSPESRRGTAWLSQACGPERPASEAQKDVCLMSKMTQPSHRRTRGTSVEARRTEWVVRTRRDALLHSCRCGRAVDSAQRFRSSSMASVSRLPRKRLLPFGHCRSACEPGCVMARSSNAAFSSRPRRERRPEARTHCPWRSGRTPP